MDLDTRLALLKQQARDGLVKVMIIGLGSVGNYLLDYLLSSGDPGLEILVVGRNREKMESDVNIAKVASMIRKQNRSTVTIVDGVDLERNETVAACLQKYQPDIIVNTSRVYAGLKYGSISWKNVRAYGIWTPLSIKYIRNIMQAYAEANSHAVVINTSYSDATIPWLKSAGKKYPDFGSGNLNHLLPRIKMAAAQMCGISDFWNIDVDLATAHFHDVVISKEGHAEGVKQMLAIEYKGEALPCNQEEILTRCSIAMPVDAKRNMMNASSNYEIIRCLLKALREEGKEKFFSPGALGEIGGYPVIINGSGSAPYAYIDEGRFSLTEMRQKNRESIYLDGVEDIRDGKLIYTDELIEKASRAFGVQLPKEIHFDQIDETAAWIVESIIKPNIEGK